MYSKDFKDLKTAPASKDGPGGFYSPDEAYGCKVDADRNKAYKAALYVIGATAGLSGGIFRLPNAFVVPFVGGCAKTAAPSAPSQPHAAPPSPLFLRPHPAAATSST